MQIKEQCPCANGGSREKQSIFILRQKWIASAIISPPPNLPRRVERLIGVKFLNRHYPERRANGEQASKFLRTPLGAAQLRFTKVRLAMTESGEQNRHYSERRANGEQASKFLRTPLGAAQLRFTKVHLAMTEQVTTNRHYPEQRT